MKHWSPKRDQSLSQNPQLRPRRSAHVLLPSKKKTLALRRTEGTHYEKMSGCTVFKITVWKTILTASVFFPFYYCFTVLLLLLRFSTLMHRNTQAGLKSRLLLLNTVPIQHVWSKCVPFGDRCTFHFLKHFSYVGPRAKTEQKH